MNNLFSTCLPQRSTHFFRAMLLIALLTTFQGCNEPDIVTDPITSQQDGSDAQLQTLTHFLAGLTGAPVDKVVYDKTEKEFTIEGDITVTRSSAVAYLNADKTARVNQRQGIWLLNDNAVKDIKVQVPWTIDANWHEAILQAMLDWNAMPNTKVHFNMITDASKADIHVSAKYGLPNPDGSPSWAAKQGLPNANGTVGGGLVVNLYYNTEAGMPLVQKRHAIAHELGHAIGLTHTDKALDGVFDYQVCNTPATDQNSVMNTKMRAWTGFSKSDLIAAEILYPKHTWKYFPSFATDVAAASGPTQWLWMVGKIPTEGGYKIYRYNYVTHQFLEVKGGADHIAVGPDGFPWIVNNQAQIYKLGSNSQWQFVPGSALDVAVGANGVAYIISTVPAPGGFAIKFWKNNQWQQMPGRGAMRIAVSSTGVAWAIDNTNKILKSNGSSMEDTGGLGRDIASGKNGSMYAIGQTAVPGGYSVKKNENGCWVQLDGGGVAITAHGNGMGPVVINNLGMVLEY